jgi:alkylated DNA repair dioxygenase AlkB
MTCILGLRYIPNYLEIEQEKQLIENIAKQQWLPDLKRRVQHYGFKYDYRSKNIDHNNYIGPIPDWLHLSCNKLYQENIFTAVPDQVIVNEYMPGQGISPHIDCIPCFREVVCSLSLGAACVMEFENKIKIPLLLEPCSLLVLSKDARFIWTHSILARKQDIYRGTKIPRKRRISLTFRTVNIKR